MDEQEAGAGDPQEERGEEPTVGSDQPAEAAGASSTAKRGNRQEGRSGDALAWLEGPAFNSPIEEMPTLQWPDGPTENDDEDRDDGTVKSGRAVDELDEAIEWLDQMGDGRGIPVDEMPTLVTRAKKDPASVEDAFVAQGLEGTAAGAQVGSQLDSDPMAWLEQLAIDQSSPLEELPSVADRLLASDIVSQIETGQDGDAQWSALASQATELDRALSYLEQLAEAEGISLDDTSFDQLDLGDWQDEAPAASEQFAPGDVPAPIVAEAAVTLAAKHHGKPGDDLAQEMPDDPDEALAWLAELEDEAAAQADLDAAVNPAEMIAEKTEELVDDIDAIPENEALETEHSAGEPAVDAEFLDEMPDDPDQAMAWMAGLAAHKTVSRKRQPQVEAVDLKEDSIEVDLPIGESDNLAENANFAPAREALSSGNIAEANGLYRSMLDSGQGGPVLIKELETAVAGWPEEPELLRLLGDAYMQDGQLQKALRAYRGGFDHL